MRISWMLALGLLTLCFEARSEPLFRCSDVQVEYGDPESMPLAGRVVVKQLKSRPGEVKPESNPEYKSYSPQRTAAFNRVLVADTTKTAPRNNSIQVFTVTGPPLAWQIDTYEMHDNASLSWINDDLLFIRIWWGRIVSTDLIFQLSSGQFIYAQEANYGLLTLPCE